MPKSFSLNYIRELIVKLIFFYIFNIFFSNTEELHKQIVKAYSTEHTVFPSDLLVFLWCFLDNGYFDKDAYSQLIPTAWIPFVNANEKNGGLQVRTCCSSSPILLKL